jgi:bacterioferritin-associated ferredoxin
MRRKGELEPVLICHCRAVNDHTVAAAIAAGARAPEDLAAMCGAGARCGGCVPALSELLETHAATSVDIARRSAA